MKTHLFSIILLIIVGLNTQAQNSLLWKISGNDLEKPSYLYGTIHLICESEMVRIADLTDVINKTEQLALEIDISEPGAMQKMQMMSMNPGMVNFSNDMSEKDRKLVDDFLTKNFGTGLTQLGIMKPWVISMMIATHDMLDCADKSAYEAKLIQIAKTAGRPITSLETVESQFAIFDNFSKEDQIEMLVESVKNKAQFDEMFDNMLTYYKKEDLKNLYEYILTSSPEMEKYSDVLLFNRNKNWVELMPSMMKEKSTLFAVGAGHLDGDLGVIKLLRKAGYKVEPVEGDFIGYIKEVTLDKAGPIIVNTIF